VPRRGTINFLLTKTPATVRVNTDTNMKYQLQVAFTVMAGSIICAADSVTPARSTSVPATITQAVKPALVAAYPARSPAIGCMPTDSKAAAARAGTTMMEASEAILPLIPRNNTVAVNAQSGTPRIALLIAVVRSPTFSEKPIAICMARTRPSGENPWKLESRFSSSQMSPSLLMRLLARTISPLVGFTTLTPARLQARLISARIRHNHKNRM